MWEIEGARNAHKTVPSIAEWQLLSWDKSRLTLNGKFNDTSI
jgi:hypothetical protein